MKTLLIATHNPGKVRDIKKGLSMLIEKGVHITSLSEIGIQTEPEETEKTFQENAKLKAKYYSKLSGLPTIADDAGLMINILQGAPGVNSRRWPGYAATDEELIQYTLQQLKGVPLEKRGATLMTCICFYDPAAQVMILECEKCKGYIAEKASSRRDKGYPFRSVFIVEAYHKYHDELTEEEHKKVNHRLLAAQRIASQIEKYLLQ